MPPDPAGRHQSGPPPTPPTPQALPQRPPVPTHNQQRPMAQALPPGGAQAGKPPQVPPPMPPSQPLLLDAQHIPKRPTRVRPGVNVSSQLLTDGHRYMRNTVKAASHLMAPPAAVIISSRNRAWDAMPDCSFAVCLGCVLLFGQSGCVASTHAGRDLYTANNDAVCSTHSRTGPLCSAPVSD